MDNLVSPCECVIIPFMKEKKPRNKKADLSSKAGRYLLAKASGKTKKEAQIVAGYKDTNHSFEIENSKQYQVIEQRYFKDVLLSQISMAQIAAALVDNIQQVDSKSIDRGSRNKAIEIAMGKIEPDKVTGEEHDKVMVILREASQEKI